MLLKAPSGSPAKSRPMPRRAPGSRPPPAIAKDGVRDVSGGSGAFAPGSIVIIGGDNLTSGLHSMPVSPAPIRPAGTHAEVNGTPAPLFSVKRDRLLAESPRTWLWASRLAHRFQRESGE
jgi:hypothetical protein